MAKNSGLLFLLAAGVIVGIAFASQNTAAAPAPAAAPGKPSSPGSVTSMNQTNNPGAIKYTTDYAGVTGSYYNATLKANFAVFDSIQSGVQAIDSNLLDNYLQDGATVEDMANEWTSGNADAPGIWLGQLNLDPDYADTGVDDDVSDLANDTTGRSYLIAGIIKNEGIYNISQPQILSWIS
jgi:hypothetical protein